MALRSNIELEMRPLLKALRARLDALEHTSTTKDKLEIFFRGEIPFLQLEIRRDHMLLDLWLPADKLEEARASGIGRAHPFMGHEAVKVRFERAEDLTRVARWLEESYHFAPRRSDEPEKPENGEETAKEGGGKGSGGKRPPPPKKTDKK